MKLSIESRAYLPMAALLILLNACVPLRVQSPGPATDSEGGQPVSQSQPCKPLSGSDNATAPRPACPPKRISKAKKPGPLHYFAVCGVPETCVAGRPWAAGSPQIIVTAYDDCGNVKTDYAGPLYFTSTDISAVLPFSSQNQFRFTPSDNGTHRFPAGDFVFKTAGRQSLVITNGKIRLKTGKIQVLPGALDHFSLAGLPSKCMSGQPWPSPAHDIVVTARDAVNNTKTDYTGLVFFKSTDPSAALTYSSKDKYLFKTEDKGVHKFSGKLFTLNSPGNHTVSITDGLRITAGNALTVLPDGSRWKRITASTGFIPRKNHSAVSFNGRLWVIGGSTGRLSNEVWNSVDGSKWEMIVEAAEFSPRSSHVTLVFDNRLWIIGGFDGNHFMGTNDVWVSADGRKWVCASRSAPFAKRYAHAGAVHNGKMWVVGGKFQSDIWSSADGVLWTRVLDSPPFGPRYGHACISFSGSLWVAGGYSAGYKSDVWSSADGLSWKQITPEAEFSPRKGHSLVAFNDRLWIIAGESAGRLQNDVWHSSSGSGWSCATKDAEFGSRSGQACTVFKNSLWLIGGSLLNDVWTAY